MTARFPGLPTVSDGSSVPSIFLRFTLGSADVLAFVDSNSPQKASTRTSGTSPPVTRFSISHTHIILLLLFQMDHMELIFS